MVFYSILHTVVWGCSSVGRASGLQPEGQRFKSAHLHPGELSSGEAQLPFVREEQGGLTRRPSYKLGFHAEKTITGQILAKIRFFCEINLTKLIFCGILRTIDE